jgi:hypothetical protein
MPSVLPSGYYPTLILYLGSLELTGTSLRRATLLY